MKAYLTEGHIHTKKPEQCEKAICCHNCPDKSVRKKVLVLRKNLSQVTSVEKGHLGNISRPRPSASASKTFPLMPFFYLGNLTNFSFTLGQFFLTICPDNYDNKILFLWPILTVRRNAAFFFLANFNFVYT